MFAGSGSAIETSSLCRPVNLLAVGTDSLLPLLDICVITNEHLLALFAAAVTSLSSFT